MCLDTCGMGCETVGHCSKIYCSHCCNPLFGFRQESVEATAEVSKTFNEKIRKYCDMTLLSCAYAGTGNVLKVFICANLIVF